MNVDYQPVKHKADGIEYTYYKRGLTYIDAQQLCKNFPTGELAVIRDNSTLSIIKDGFRRYSHKYNQTHEYFFIKNYVEKKIQESVEGCKDDQKANNFFLYIMIIDETQTFHCNYNASLSLPYICQQPADTPEMNYTTDVLFLSMSPSSSSTISSSSSSSSASTTTTTTSTTTTASTTASTTTTTTTSSLPLQKSSTKLTEQQSSTPHTTIFDHTQKPGVFTTREQYISQTLKQKQHASIASTVYDSSPQTQRSNPLLSNPALVVVLAGCLILISMVLLIFYIKKLRSKVKNQTSNEDQQRIDRTLSSVFETPNCDNVSALQKIDDTPNKTLDFESKETCGNATKGYTKPKEVVLSSTYSVAEDIAATTFNSNDNLKVVIQHTAADYASIELSKKSKNGQDKTKNSAHAAATSTSIYAVVNKPKEKTTSTNYDKIDVFVAHEKLNKEAECSNLLSEDIYDKLKL